MGQEAKRENSLDIISIHRVRHVEWGLNRYRLGGLVFPSLSELWLKQQYKDLSDVRPRNCVSSH